MSTERISSLLALEELAIAGQHEGKQSSQPVVSEAFMSVPHVRTESEIKKNDSTMYSPLSTLIGDIADGISSSNVFSPLVVDGRSYAEYVTKKRPEEKMSSVGRKDDSSKPPLAYIPKAALYAEGEAFAFGAKKYDAWNYRNGIAVSRTLSAALRHIQQFLAGQDHDDESGVHHLGCARANLAMALDTLENHPEFDDRYKEKK